MNDLVTIWVFALLLVGFGYAFTIGARPEGIRVNMGAICIVSGALLAVGSTVLSLFAIFALIWGAKW